MGLIFVDYNNKGVQMVLFQRKKRYSKISYQKRLTLIHLIENQKLTIAKASKRLHIKVPTAKVILANYRKTGKILHKKTPPKENQSHLSVIKVEECLESLVGNSREEAEAVQPSSYCWLYYSFLPVPMLFLPQ